MSAREHIVKPAAPTGTGLDFPLGQGPSMSYSAGHKIIPPSLARGTVAQPLAVEVSDRAKLVESPISEGAEE